MELKIRYPQPVICGNEFRRLYLEDFDLAAGRVQVLQVFPALVLSEGVDLNAEGDPFLPSVLSGGELCADAVDLQHRRGLVSLQPSLPLAAVIGALKPLHGAPRTTEPPVWSTQWSRTGWFGLVESKRCRHSSSAVSGLCRPCCETKQQIPNRQKGPERNIPERL